MRRSFWGGDRFAAGTCMNHGPGKTTPLAIGVLDAEKESTKKTYPYSLGTCMTIGILCIVM